MATITFDTKGREVPDPRPMELAPGATHPETLESMLQRFVRQEISRRAADQGEESFEEANDFDIEEDDFEYDSKLTQYEEMGREPIDVIDAEERIPATSDSGPAESAGFRAVGTGAPAGPGQSEAGSVDDGAMHDEAAPLPASAGKGNMGGVPGAATLQRPRKSA